MPKYQAEHREEINQKKTVDKQIEVDREVCGCNVRKNKRARHGKTEKHRKGVERGGGDGNMGRHVAGGLN